MLLQKKTAPVWLCSFAALVASAGLAGPAEAQSEVTLSAISNLPTRVIYVRHFIDYVKKVNAAGKGIVQIKYRGGPEVTPSQKQGQALRTGIVDMNYGIASFYKGIVPHVDAMVGSLRTGIVDMNYGIASFYKGIVPHVDAMVGSTIDAVESRKQGHTDFLGEIWRKRINAHLLGWFSSGAGWYIYTVNEPKLNADGSVNFSGVKIRSSPSTRDFITALGATVGLIHSSEVYTALERGVVNGNVFPGMGVTDYGWEKFLKWRIEPQFLQTNAVVMVNLDKWNGLPKKAQALLQKIAIEHEKDSRDVIAQEAVKELGRLKAAGMQQIELKGGFRMKYLKTARDVFWKKLGKSVPKDVAELRRRFYQ